MKNTNTSTSSSRELAARAPALLALVCALAVPTASLARTVSVAAIKDGAATAAFGDPDGAAYTLAWGYGPADGGDTTNGWAHFETLGAVAADATAATYPLPAGWGDTATHLRFFLLEPELPAAATRVEYLESSGTQWLNSGVNLSSNDTVAVDYANPATFLTKSVDLFGVHKYGMTARYVFSYDSSSGTTTMLFHRANGTQGATSTATDVTATPGTRQTVTMKIGPGTSSIVSASGETLFSKTLTSQTVKQDATAPLAIFACNSSQNGIMALSAAKIYAFRIYDENNALRLDLVPCTVGGTPAMFDRVTQGYLYNDGTGDFATGAAIATPLLVAASSATASTADYGEPDAWLDYVEATGTQSVLLGGCTVGPDYRLVAEYAYPDPIAKKNNCLFGVYKQGATAGFYYGNNDLVAFSFWRGTGAVNASTATGVSATPGERQTVVMDLGSGASSIYAADGHTVWSGSLNGSLTADSTSAISLFTATGTTGYESAAKIHSFRIYDGTGALAHHFLPCLKGDAAVLYDKQTGRTFFPQGGALVAGPVLPRPAELVEWVQSDGADGDRQLYIDTGIPAKAGVGMVAEMAWATKPAGYGVDNIFCGATSSSGQRIWLYDAVAEATGSTATHRFGYNNWKLQLQGDGNVPTAGTRYRVDAFLAAGAQTLHVQALDGSGYDLSRSYNDSASINAERTLYVFANNHAGTAEPISAQARLYSLVLTNELGLVRDFVPCVADNGRAGLYDRFSERVFFPQAAVAGAAADFDFASEVGAVTNVLIAPAAVPAARLSYVESNGTSDFVDLGVIGRDGTKMVAEMEWVTLDSPATFCGAASGTSSLFTTYRINDDQQRMGYANGSRTINSGTVAPVAGTRYRVTTTLDDGAQSLLVEKKVDGVWTRSGSTDRTDAGPMDTGLPLTLFARNLNGVPDEFAAARVYSLKLWQKDGNGDYALVRDLVPAKAPSGAAVLWDRVGKRFYRNSGGRYGLTGGTESQWIDGFYLRFW